MKEGRQVSQEAQLADLLRSEILKNSQSVVEKTPAQKNTENFEYISTQKQPYVSPIFTMSEDEILAFVEEFEINELATLSSEELNHISQVLGVESIL